MISACLVNNQLSHEQQQAIDAVVAHLTTPTSSDTDVALYEKAALLQLLKQNGAFSSRALSKEQQKAFRNLYKNSVEYVRSSNRLNFNVRDMIEGVENEGLSYKLIAQRKSAKMGRRSQPRQQETTHTNKGKKRSRRRC